MKNISLILVIFVSTNYFSQETNIDVESISNLWATQILNTTKYQNGDSIYSFRGDLKDFISLNRPLYTIHNGVYFYNWRAVNDERKIVPKGFVIPTMAQFEQLNKYSKNLILTKNKTNRGLFIDPSKKIFYLPSVGYIDEAGYTIGEETTQYFWTKEKSEEDLEFSKSAKIAINDSTKKYSFELDLMYSDNGLPVIYLQDVNNIIKDRVFSYDSLMPLEYKKFINSIYQTLILSFSKDVRVNLIGNIEFGLNGINKSNFDKIKLAAGSGIDKNELLKNLHTKLLNLESPFYQGKNLLSNKNFSIDFSIIHSKNREQGFFSYNFFNENKVSSELKNNMMVANDLNFKYIKSTKNSVLTIGDELIREPNKNYITKFIPYGPLYSLYSVIPGLGILKVEPLRKKRAGSKMIYFSIPVGTIALGSFVYSTNQYSDYKSSLDPSTFSRANSMHKIFLTALTTYAILGVIDYTRTFIKGTKNMKLARKINKEIKEKYKGGLLY